MSESSTISRHALTVLAGQLAVMAFGVTDTIVAGRYAQEALAALGYTGVHNAGGLGQAVAWARQRNSGT